MFVNVEILSCSKEVFNRHFQTLLKGNCIEISNGSLVLRDCTLFKFGCPEEHTRSNEFYKCKNSLLFLFTIESTLTVLYWCSSSNEQSKINISIFVC